MHRKSLNARNDSLYHNSVYLISSPYLYLLLILGLCIPCRWPVYWLISGAPILEAVLLAGAAGERSGGCEKKIGGNLGMGSQEPESSYTESAACTRILPGVPLWPLTTTLDLTYCICRTSWLFYYLFTVTCWSSIPIICLFQFPIAGQLLRKQLRKILLSKTWGLQFIDDRIGIFDIPGLEIDTKVDGLVVVRGVTLILSEMSLTVHGVEVVLKLMVGEGKDGEIIDVGIGCEEVVVRLGRGIEVGDCFVSVKRGERGMGFKDVRERIGGGRWAGDQVSEVDLKMLKVVKGNGNGNRNVQNGQQNLEAERKWNNTVKNDITDGHAPKDTDIKKGIEAIKTIAPDDTKAANDQYHKTISAIRSTNSIQTCRQEVQRLVDSGAGKKADGTEALASVNENSNNDICAAICSQLHRQPSITHPPTRSIKVTTLQTLIPPHIRTFLHRLPMLIRLLLSPIAHFHPVKISSVTATGSGKWIQEILEEKLFKTDIYTPPSSPRPSTFPSSTFKLSDPSPTFSSLTSKLTNPSSTFSSFTSKLNNPPLAFSTPPTHPSNPSNPTPEEQTTIPQIQHRINNWLLPSTFILELRALTGTAQIPMLPSYDIQCSVSSSSIIAYRSLPYVASLKQVLRLGGADVSFQIPSFLLPCHEHLLPVSAAHERIVCRGDGFRGQDGEFGGVVRGGEREGNVGKDENEDEDQDDECIVRIGAHVRLPMVMDQELLDWIASVVKASKVMEMEVESRWMDEEIRGFRDLVGVLKGGVRDEARGDVGYAGEIKVPLGPFRLSEEARVRKEGVKILP
ncbi:e7fdd15e-8288-412d-9e4e-1ad462be898c [Sclerotinia trifoliorum]|uniref:E7fdd15e-8288-412d-9e4e-1ad462be898c n=1 Tax=Sclerotinia trifoliorum TaxID=28548 RepID=A0A8H2ZJ92_9HELO|nr:e7fdd15e-8288-412d-9e4e-1ad462be898c [Sclerotinia trifoliorum]